MQNYHVLFHCKTAALYGNIQLDCPEIAGRTGSPTYFLFNHTHIHTLDRSIYVGIHGLGSAKIQSNLLPNK